MTIASIEINRVEIIVARANDNFVTVYHWVAVDLAPGKIALTGCFELPTQCTVLTVEAIEIAIKRTNDDLVVLHCRPGVNYVARLVAPQKFSVRGFQRIKATIASAEIDIVISHEG